MGLVQETKQSNIPLFPMFVCYIKNVVGYFQVAKKKRMCLFFSKTDSSTQKKGQYSFCHALLCSIQKGWINFNSQNSINIHSSPSSSSIPIVQPIPFRPLNMVAEFLQQQANSQQTKDTKVPIKNESHHSRDHHRSAPLKAIGNYSFQQSLGKGSMGKVKLGVHNVTGEKVYRLINQF